MSPQGDLSVAADATQKLAVEQWKEIAEAFCPKVHLATRPYFPNQPEDYQPCSLEWFLQHSKLNIPNRPSIQHPSVQDLLANNQSGTQAALLDSRYRSGDLGTAKIFAHIRRAPHDLLFVDIQYWFFYAYNGAVPIQPFFGNHEGDWEHITVRVSNWWSSIDKISVEGVFFAAHGYSDGRWITKAASSPEKDRYAFVKGTRHPIVFSAYNTHASYESAGIQWREATWYFLQDFTSEDGPVWGPTGVAELVALAPDLVRGAPFTDAPWLQFRGRWGDDGVETPSFQDPWSDDGDNGFYARSLETLAEIGNDWSPARYATSIAFGTFGGQWVVGVTRDRGDPGGTFILYSYDKQLKYLATGGEGWPPGRTAATSIAFGRLNEQDVVLVGAAGDKGFFGCYGWDPALGRLHKLSAEEICDNVSMTSVAFGVLDDAPAVGIAVAASYGLFRVKLYNRDGTVKATLDGGADWYDGVSSIAFGDLDEPVVGVTRSARALDKSPETAFIYRYDARSGNLRLLATDLGLWEVPPWGATNIAFGVMNDEPVVVITRQGESSGKGPRFIVCRYRKEQGERNGRLEVMARGPEGPGAVASFGRVNGQTILSMSGPNYGHDRDAANPALYVYDGGGLAKYYDIKDPSGSARGGRSTAFGRLANQPVYGVAFGNFVGAKPKALILRWRHATR